MTIVGIAALGLTACGGSSSSSSSSAPASSSSSSGPAPAGLKGTPIKTMTITSINSTGPTFPNIAVTAQTYAKWINAHGGINGHPLQVEICDDQGTPTSATACARKAVQDNVVSVVGSYSFFGDNIVPVLAASKITWFGVCCAGTPSELTSPDSFPLGSSLMYAVGEVKKAVQDGCKGVNAVIVDGAQPYIPPMLNAVKALGKSFGTSPIIVPPKIQDESALVAKATSGAQCLAMVLDESLFKPWFAALKASGSTARMYGPQGNLDAVSIKGNESVANGDIVVGSFPDISTAPWADYRAALAKYGASTSYDYNSLGGLGTWAGYSAFTVVAKAIKGAISPSSFYDQASKTTNLNLNGMVPPVDFTKPWTNGLKGYTRLFNRSVVFSAVKNGKIVPLTTTFQDMSNLAMGKTG